MNKVVGLIILVLGLGAIAWWVLEDRDEAPAPYAEAMLEGQSKAGARRVEGDFRALHTTLTQYASMQGSYPEGDLGKALGPYMARVPSRDPWGTGYRYERRGEESYELRSAGPDREFGTGDDVVMENGAIMSR